MRPSTISYADQLGFFDPDKFATEVHIAGIGGIGSALLFFLAKLGVPKIHIWDPDVVEKHNVPAQLIYRPSDVKNKLLKVDAARAFLERQEYDGEIITHPEMVTADSELDGIVMSGVDSMTSRNAIWEAVRANGLVELYFDGRIGGEQIQLLTVSLTDLEQCEKYEAFLFDDEEASQLPCALRTVIHPAGLLAYLMVGQLTLYTREKGLKFNITADLENVQVFAFA
jgi:molybdopterin-synthase adenylyltransferase